MIWTENRTLKINCSTPALAIGISKSIIATCNSNLFISEKFYQNFPSVVIKLIHVLSILQRQYTNHASCLFLIKFQVIDTIFPKII